MRGSIRCPTIHVCDASAWKFPQVRCRLPGRKSFDQRALLASPTSPLDGDADRNVSSWPLTAAPLDRVSATAIESPADQGGPTPWPSSIASGSQHITIKAISHWIVHSLCGSASPRFRLPSGLELARARRHRRHRSITNPMPLPTHVQGRYHWRDSRVDQGALSDC
jgi:hypothetical protein